MRGVNILHQLRRREKWKSVGASIYFPKGFTAWGHLIGWQREKAIFPSVVCTWAFRESTLQ